MGIELTLWLDESQIGREKKVESVELSFRDALQPEPPNQTEHIRFLWMAPRRRLKRADEHAFKTELLALTEEIDRRWESEPDWQSPQGFLWSISRAILPLRNTCSLSTFIREAGLMYPL